jgi:hypothetical protein
LDDADSARKFRQFIELVDSMPFPVGLWETQNTLYGPLREFAETQRTTNGDNPAKKTVGEELNQLTERLKIASP